MLQRDRRDAEPHEARRLVGVRSKKRSPGSMMTLRAAAASARPRASVPRGPSSQSEVPPAEFVECQSGRKAEIAWTSRLRRSSKARGQTPHQRLVVAERQEQGHRALVVGRRMAQHEAAQRPQFRDQLGRRHDVAHPQAGRERLRHRADIDDAARAVEALQRLLRRLVEKLAVIAVLDDDLVVAGGARQQVLPALGRQRHHGRAMMARRHEDEARIVGDRLM